MIDWQIIFVAGITTGWFGRPLAQIVIDKFAKGKLNEGEGK